MCGRNMWQSLKAEPASLEWVSSVALGAQEILKFGWQLETVIESLQQENPNLAQRLEDKRKENLASTAVTVVGVLVCSSGIFQELYSRSQATFS